jgi:hypothetical protein
MITSVSSVEGFRVVGSETADTICMTLLGPVSGVSEVGGTKLGPFDGSRVNSTDPVSVPLD